MIFHTDGTKVCDITRPPFLLLAGVEVHHQTELKQIILGDSCAMDNPSDYRSEDSRFNTVFSEPKSSPWKYDIHFSVAGWSALINELRGDAYISCFFLKQIILLWGTMILSTLQENLIELYLKPKGIKHTA